MTARLRYQFVSRQRLASRGIQWRHNENRHGRKKDVHARGRASSRLRHEIASLFRSFDRAERALVPLVATVQTDRDRLAARLARLTEPGTDPTRR